MDVMDFNKLQDLTDQMENIVSQMEDFIPDDEVGEEVATLVLDALTAWTKLESFCYRMGRDPQDIIKGERNG